MFESSGFWGVSLHGQSGGQGFTLDVSVFSSYTGPGTYTGDAAVGDLSGSFTTLDGSGWSWGGAPPAGTPGTLTIDGSGKGGSFDLTLRPTVSAPLPLSSLMHITGSFNCPGYAPETGGPDVTPTPGATANTSCSAAGSLSRDATAAGPGYQAQTAGEVDISVARIEVVQSIQDSAGSVPRIAGKNTLVRVFVQKSGAGDDLSAYVSLNATGPDGQPLSVTTVAGGHIQEWSEVCVVAQTAVDRTSVQANEAQFRLGEPPEGPVTISATVRPAVGSGTDSNPQNDSASVNVRFETGYSRRLAFVGVCTGIDSEGKGVGCPEATFKFDLVLQVDRARRMFPAVDDVDGLLPTYLPGPDWIWPGQTWWERLDPRVNAAGLLVAWLRSRYLMMSAGLMATHLDSRPEVLIGMIGSNSSVAGDGMADAYTSGLGAGHTAWVKASSAVAVPILLGQLWGLPSRVTGDCSAPPSIGEPGFEHLFDILISYPEWVFKPPTSPDFMTGCGNAWISPDSFKILYGNQLRTPLIQTKTSSAGHQAALRAGAVAEVSPSGDALLVTGALRIDGSVGELGPATRLAGAAAVASGQSATDSPYCLEFSGSAGALQRTCFELAPQPIDGVMPEQDGFAVLLPIPAGATRIALTANGTELDSIGATPASPTITVDAHANERWDAPRELSWSVADADSDRLDVNVLYSPDGGTSWLPYAPSWQSDALTIEPSELQAGNQNMFRILASDGFNTTSADIGPISVSSGVGQDLGFGGECEFERDCEPPAGPNFPDPGQEDAIVLVLVVGLGMLALTGIVVGVVLFNRRQRALAPVFLGTHVVPAEGLPAWWTPDPTGPSTPLAGGVELAVREFRPDGWAFVVAANGWSGWVDGRRLVPRR